MSKEFIAFDWCGAMDSYGRFTHMPSGKTLVQEKWMGQSDWDSKQLEWFKTFDSALVVHKNLQNGAYRETGDTFGTVGEIIEKLERRFA
jgi:hypothetical protein